MTVSTSGMVVSLEPESRFPMSGHEGHDGRNTQITVLNRKKNNLVIFVKDARYNIDMDLAKAILI